MVQRKNPDSRPIQGRYKGQLFNSLFKLVLLLGLAFGGYKGYQYFTAQNKKDLSVLMKEYEDGAIANELLIKQKASEENVGAFIGYCKSNSPKVKELAAQCLGKIHSVKGFSALSELAKDKEASIRTEAIKAIGEIKDKQSIEFLIGLFDKEEDKGVLGEIGYSLRALTGENPTSQKADFWKTWWKENKSSFKFQ